MSVGLDFQRSRRNLVEVPGTCISIGHAGELPRAVKRYAAGALTIARDIAPKRKAPEIREEFRGLLGAGGRTQQKSKLVIPFISEG